MPVTLQGHSKTSLLSLSKLPNSSRTAKMVQRKFAVLSGEKLGAVKPIPRLVVDVAEVTALRGVGVAVQRDVRAGEVDGGSTHLSASDGARVAAVEGLCVV